MQDPIEQEIQAKGLTAPRITPADIEANISGEYFFTAADATAGCPQFEQLRLLTFCASPENFDAEIGRKIARQNAVQKVWPLMGYELRSQLSKGA